MNSRFFLISTLAIVCLVGCTRQGIKPPKGSSETFTLSASKRVELALEVKDRPVNLSKKDFAFIETNKGNFVIELYSKDSPATVSNFIRLAKAGFYDGLIWHRYVEGFVIQGGDPTGTGRGNPGYTIDFEVNSKTHEKGAVGMARGPDLNSGSCQFYVCLESQNQLDGAYCVFGIVTSGMDVVEMLRAEDSILRITVEK